MAGIPGRLFFNRYDFFSIMSTLAGGDINVLTIVSDEPRHLENP